MSSTDPLETPALTSGQTFDFVDSIVAAAATPASIARDRVSLVVCGSDVTSSQVSRGVRSIAKPSSTELLTDET